MPTRRRLGRGLQAAGDAILGLAQMQLQNQLIRDRQQALIDAQTEAAREGRVFRQVADILPDIQSGDVHPNQAAASLSVLTGREVDPEQLAGAAPSIEQAISAVMEEFGDRELGELGGPGDVQARLRDFYAFRGEPGVDPSAVGPVQPMVSEILGLPARRREELIEAEPPTEVSEVGPGGTAQTRFVNPRLAQAGGQRFRTERTAQEELARMLGTNLAPEAQEARVGEAVTQLQREAPTRQAISAAQGADAAHIQTQADRTQRDLETGDAVADFTLTFNNLVESSDRVIQAEGGLDVPLQALELQVGRLFGGSPELRAFRQDMAMSLRPVARMFGMTEANISESEQSRAHEMIGLSTMSTQQERVDALRKLRDVGMIAPLMRAQNLPESLSFTQRIQMALEGTDATRAAEQARIDELEAMEAAGQVIEGQPYFQDPITGTWAPVIR